MPETPKAATPPAFWLFAYGSLMWDPGFAPVETCRARLPGWRRSFCMWSIHYRGTAANPGLVLALDRKDGAGCDGLALGVAATEAAAVLALLRERELVSSAYEERRLPVTLEDGARVEALAYVIAPRHPQHCPDLALEDQARIIAGATGERGPNRDYLAQTAQHLETMGIRDPDLGWLARRVRELG